MVERALTWDDIVFAIIAIAAGVIAAGMVRLAVRRLRKRLSQLEWVHRELVVDALRDLASSALVVAGLWVGATRLPLTATTGRWTYRILAAALILFVALAASRLIGGLVRSLLVRAEVAGSASIFVNIARLATFAVGVLVVLQTVGVSVTPLLTAMGVGGIAVALALQDTLANLFAGVHLLASRKLQPGNYIQMPDGHEGYVVDINWRNTTMQDLYDNMVVVPNAMIASNALINCDQPSKRQLILIPCGVDYNSDLSHVERVTVAVAREVLADVDGGDTSFEPLVRFNNFGDSSIDFSVIVQVEEFGDQYLVKHELIKSLHERFRAEGISIPFPMRTVHVTEDAKAADTTTPTTN